MWSVLDSASWFLGEVQTSAKQALQGFSQTLHVPRVIKDYYEHPNLAVRLAKVTGVMTSLTALGIALNRCFSSDEGSDEEGLGLVTAYGMLMSTVGLYLTSFWAREFRTSLKPDEPDLYTTEEQYISDTLFYLGAMGQLSIQHFSVPGTRQLLGAMTAILDGMSAHTYGLKKQAIDAVHWDYFLGFGTGGYLFLWWAESFLQKLVGSAEAKLMVNGLYFLTTLYLIHQTHYSNLEAMKEEGCLKVDLFKPSRILQERLTPYVKKLVDAKHLNRFFLPASKEARRDIEAPADTAFHPLGKQKTA